MLGTKGLRLFLCAVLAGLACGLKLPAATVFSRRAAFAAAVGASSTLLQPPRPAMADSKKDFESCISKCVYEATKITKGVAQVDVMPRSEAFAMCKPKCATSKKDLTRGGSRDSVNLNDDGTRKEQ